MTSHADLGKQQYLSDELFDARYFKPLDRFDIRFAPIMWVYDNVRPGANVLHFGCGPGMLALLKRKGVTITGVDTSKERAEAARRNGYDATFQTDLTSLPFANETFDYVVSFGVLDSLNEAEEKSLLSEMKRVLRKGGVNLHSIQCSETVTDSDQSTRFLEFFPHVAIEPRNGFCLSAADFLSLDERQVPKLDTDFLDYLRELTFKERRAFDLAMGYVLSRISDLDLSLPSFDSHVLLKASEAPLGPFYSEHRDRKGLFFSSEAGQIANGICLDRSSLARFDEGWFQPTLLPPVARWMGKQGRIRFHADDVATITLDLTTQLPDLQKHPLGLEIFLNGVKLCSFTLFRYGWLQLSVSVPEALSARSNGEFELELRASRTAQLRQSGDAVHDDREVSAAVCNIEIRDQNRLR
ncbi:MAG TPA: class I SAM-dependent methyltransferase [Pyrinomonadaceae bacterium]|nr:class I SAM-dependent methyltransferase [Pyrinomonadaceae bacterium]